MTTLYIACALFLGIHLLIAGTPLRGAIVSVIGDGPFKGLFSLASLGGIVWMGWTYAQVKGTGLLWIAPDWWVHAGSLLVLFGFLFAVIGITTPNPTSVQAEGMLKQGGAAKGMVRVTRHPFLWGVILWGGFHLSVNGDLASVVFFGTFIALAFLGTFSIDAKRKAAYGEDWSHFARETSNIPFLAIVSGRNRLSLGEIGFIRPVAALITFAAVYYFHGFLFGPMLMG